MFIVSKYFLHKRKKSIGIAADVTTFLLFFSVSHVYSLVFCKEYWLPINHLFFSISNNFDVFGLAYKKRNGSSSATSKNLEIVIYVALSILCVPLGIRSYPICIELYKLIIFHAFSCNDILIQVFVLIQ